MSIKTCFTKTIEEHNLLLIKEPGICIKKRLEIQSQYGAPQVCRTMLLFPDGILRLNSMFLMGCLSETQSNLVTVLNEILSFLPVMLSLVETLQISQCPGMKIGRCEYGKNRHSAPLTLSLSTSQGKPTLSSIFKNLLSRIQFHLSM